jgi:hypothetical protein
MRAVALIIAFVVTACGGNAQQKALKASYVSLNAARDGFLAWTEARQEAIVRKAMTAEEAKAGIAAHREKQQLVFNTFSSAYEALALAALEPNAENLDEALARIQRLRELIKRATEE